MNRMLDEYLDYLCDVRDLPQTTIRSYRSDIISWCDFLSRQQSCLEEAGLPLARSYIADQRGSGLSPSALNRRLSALKGFYRYLSDNYRLVNPFVDLRQRTNSRHLPRWISEDEFEKLLAVCGNDFCGARDRLLCELLFSTGCRVAEAAALDCDQIDGDSILIRGKGRRLRTVFLGSPARRALSIWLPLRCCKVKNEVEKALFINHRGGRLTSRGIFFLIRRLALRAGVGGRISPHSFRHGFATALFNGGADIRMVQEMLGHSSLSTTQIYTHTAINRLRQLYRQSHPHGRGKGGAAISQK